MKRHVQEVFDKDFPQVRRLDRKQEFHAPVQVTGHEVGAAEKQFFLPAIAKIIEPCVFQEPSDDRGHGDGFTDAGNPRTKPADPSNLKVDCDTGLGRSIEGLNTSCVHQGVHLERQVPVSLFLVPLNLPLNPLQNLFPHQLGRHEQFGVGIFAGVTG